MNLKKTSDQLLRGGFCAVWVFGAFLTLCKVGMSAAADPDSPDALKFVLQAFLCAAVTIGAAVIHAYLIKKAIKPDANKTDDSGDNWWAF